MKAPRRDNTEKLGYMPGREKQIYDRSGLDEAHQKHSGPKGEQETIFRRVDKPKCAGKRIDSLCVDQGWRRKACILPFHQHTHTGAP
ncbi:hypothetical protein NQZ68_005950 [Dissostichus eleginoides]|nr:hypothetical protein NQZ68_005950 [Dissostichus eleginoides]